MQVNSSFIIIKIVKLMSINSSHNRSIHTTIRYSLDYSYTSKFIRGTFLTLPLKLTNSKRFMWKSIFKGVGHASKVLKALETKAPALTAKVSTTPNIPDIAPIKPLITPPNYLLRVPLEYSPKSLSDLFLYREPYISGISYLYPHERKKLHDDIIYSEEYFKVFALQMATSLTYGFKEGKITAKSVYIAMSDIFSFAKAASHWVEDPVTRGILQQKLLSMIQHVNAFVFQDKRFDLKELSQFLENTIDFMYYKHITVSTIGEVFVARKTLNNILSKEDFAGDIKAVDHESPYLDQGDIYKSSECQEQISQTHSDFRISFYHILDNGIQLKNVYRDVKMDYRGPLTGHLVIRPFLTLNVRIFKDYCNDLTTQIQAILSRRPLAKGLEDILKDAFDRIKDIREKAKLDILQKQFEMLKDLLSTLSFDSILIANHIHMTLIEDLRINDDILLREIVQNIEKDTSLSIMFDDTVVFPNKSKISDIAWVKIHKIILQSIERHVPESVRDAVRTNYTEHFIEFCTRHAIDYH